MTNHGEKSPPFPLLIHVHVWPITGKNPHPPPSHLCMANHGEKSPPPFSYKYMYGQSQGKTLTPPSHTCMANHREKPPPCPLLIHVCMALHTPPITGRITPPSPFSYMYDQSWGEIPSLPPSHTCTCMANHREKPSPPPPFSFMYGQSRGEIPSPLLIQVHVWPITGKNPHPPFSYMYGQSQGETPSLPPSNTCMYGPSHTSHHRENYPSLPLLIHV